MKPVLVTENKRIENLRIQYFALVRHNQALERTNTDIDNKIKRIYKTLEQLNSIFGPNLSTNDD